MFDETHFTQSPPEVGDNRSIDKNAGQVMRTENDPARQKVENIVQMLGELQGGNDVVLLADSLVNKLTLGEISSADYIRLRQLVKSQVSVPGSTAHNIFSAAERRNPAFKNPLPEAAPKQPLSNSETVLAKLAAVANDMKVSGDTSSPRLQAAINAYKTAARLAGITDDAQIKQQIRETIQQTGLIINEVSSSAVNAPISDQIQAEAPTQPNGQSTKTEAEPVANQAEANASLGTWKDITGEVAALRPNDSEFISLIRTNLSQPEENYVFRMMSKQEFDRVQSTGTIGGQQTAGQVDSGVTWWGDSLADSLNQRGGAVYTDGNGAVWGGDNGILVAVKRSTIEKAALEKRLRDPAKGSNAGYDAYKTNIPISRSDMTEVFKIEPGRGDNMGVYQAAKLT